MSLKYANRYQIKKSGIPYKDLTNEKHESKDTSLCSMRCLACERDKKGNGIFGKHTPYIYAEPDKKSNGKEKGECWLMNENGIINPLQMTAVLSAVDLTNPVAA